MPFNWNKLELDWKEAMSNPATANNKDVVVAKMVAALKLQMDQAGLIGTTSDGATLVTVTTKIV
ncbi:MAG: hypothetical protein JJE55_06835 [Flavobacteriaceae bacterium]|nr:hypothetical protein [Flavobacteriaceae bacterium]